MNLLPKTKGCVTIGIPTRNRSGFVVRAIRSALAQSYANIEVVVSDNASTDDSVTQIEKLRDPRIVLLKQPENIGMVGNFNACLSSATGEMFLLLSDDDILEPKAIEQLSSPFLSQVRGIDSQQVGLTWCPCNIINAQYKRLWTSGAGPESESSLDFVLAQFNGARGPRLCSIMVRTNDALLAGGYNQNRYGAICDMGNWTRVALNYSYVVCVTQPLANYMIHPMSVTNRTSIHEWIGYAENLNQDLLTLLKERRNADACRRLRTASANQTTNQIVTLLMQAMGEPGQLPRVLREAFVFRRHLLTIFALKRLMRDGWKLLRIRH